MITLSWLGKPLQASTIASLASVAQGGTAHNSAQQARKKADVLVLNLAATDHDGHSAQEEVEKWDATISDLMKKLHAAHENRDAAFKMTQNESARQCALEDDLQNATESTSRVLEIIDNAKRQRFDQIDL